MPFHAARLATVVAQLERDAARLDVRFERSTLRCAVLATDDGRDLRADDQSGETLLATLLHLTLSRRVDWPRTTAKVAREQGVTHVVDFGPGAFCSVQSLLAFTHVCFRRQIGNWAVVSSQSRRRWRPSGAGRRVFNQSRARCARAESCFV